MTNLDHAYEIKDALEQIECKLPDYQQDSIQHELDVIDEAVTAIINSLAYPSDKAVRQKR